ncbi:MAG: N-acetyl-gamma-glutamyl-phosphate reductase [Thermoanaerobaculia bacterium]|nr:N-acetyl-gamma-glutamyl-phosphate reductase [Thermoanaerobaculia bacterium]
MKIRISIAGATGYAGAELAAILARHPSAELAGVFSGGSGKAAPFASLHPSLRGVDGPAVAPFSIDAILAGEPDAIFLATPNEMSAVAVPELLKSGATVIDLSGSFRLRDASIYPEKYGFEHPAPELLASAVYGLTEWCNGSLAGAKLVANPGCYPTSILLATRPLRPLLSSTAPIVCDAKSGVSGAGKRSETDYSFTELAGNFKAYAVGTHRHEPEIAAWLEHGEPSVIFVPHLLPVPRGILATIYLSFGRPTTNEEIASLFDAAYAGAPFVHVHPAGTLPSLHDVVGTPRCEIGFALLAGGKGAVVVSVIDNLLKGAASQAVQNFNRVFGLGETEGLA